MSEPAADQEVQAAAVASQPPRMNRQQDKAMAESSPDFNLLMARIGRYLLRPIEGSGFYHLVLNLSRTGAGMWIISLMIFFVVGLPAINGATIFYQAMAKSGEEQRKFQLDMFQLQTDLEIKKLDRTMLGEGAMQTLSSISKKLDAQGLAIQQTNDQVGRLSQDFAGLQRTQAAMRAQQLDMQKRIEQQPGKR